MQKYIVLDIEKLPDGYYLATSRDVQGLVAQGRTFEEAVDIARDIAQKILEERKSDNENDFSEKIIYPMLVNF